MGVDRLEIHKKVIKHHGWVNQIEKFIEEMGELTKELWEYMNSESNVDKVVDEFGDLLNMIEQFELIAKQREMFSHLDVDKKQNEKMNRELERINK